MLLVHYFSVDQEFIYEPFFADFGAALSSTNSRANFHYSLVRLLPAAVATGRASQFLFLVTTIP